MRKLFFILVFISFSNIYVLAAKQNSANKHLEKKNLKTEEHVKNHTGKKTAHSGIYRYLY